MALDLNPTEKYELAELLRRTIAAERDLSSFRTIALQAILDKLEAADNPAPPPTTGRHAAIRRFVGEWQQEVSTEDAVLRQRVERAQAARTGARRIGFMMIGLAVAGFVALLIALTL